MKIKLLLIANLCIAGLSAQIPQNGLMAFFSFNGNAKDSGTYKTHGTVHGATLTADRFGNPNSAYAFSSTAKNYIDFASTNVTNATYSYSLWAKIDTLPDNGSMGFALNIGKSPGDQSVNAANHYLTTNGWQGGGYNKTSPNYGCGQNSNLSTANWIHVVVVRATNYALLILNNIVVDSIGTATARVPDYGSGTAKAMIGIRNDLSMPFNGKIDDVAIYNRPITYAEVFQLYKDPTLDVKAAKTLNFTLYPNPSNGSFTLDLTELKEKSVSGLKIFDNLGKEIYAAAVQATGAIQLNSQLSAGIYSVALTDGSGAILGMQRIAIQ